MEIAELHHKLAEQAVELDNARNNIRAEVRKEFEPTLLVKDEKVEQLQLLVKDLEKENLELQVIYHAISTFAQYFLWSLCGIHFPWLHEFHLLRTLELHLKSKVERQVLLQPIKSYKNGVSTKMFQRGYDRLGKRNLSCT